MINSSLKRRPGKSRTKKFSPGRIKSAKKKMTKRMNKEFSLENSYCNRGTNLSINKRSNVSASHKFFK